MVDFTRSQTLDTEVTQTNFKAPLVAMTSLFFLWGFITVLNDLLIPQFKQSFSLNYTQTMLIQFCFFMAYFLMSAPSGFLVKKLGYKAGMQIGLVISSIGCYLFYPAAELHQYSLFLGALFVLASGFALMQVSANPYVAALGKPETAASRLNFAGACNSFGTMVGPLFGVVLISTAAVSVGAKAVQTPYIVLGSLMLVIAGIFLFIRLPKINKIESTPQSEVSLPITQAPHLMFGILGIFFYVGAEVSIGSFIISYFNSGSMPHMDEAEAAKLLSFYWGGAFVGRSLGALVTRYISADKVLAFNGCVAIILLFITMNFTGSMAVWSVLAVGLCNSIMFPNIFSSAIYELRAHTSKGSGLLCAAIVGGALVPLLQGVIADYWDVKSSFIIPLICYTFIVTFALNLKKMQQTWVQKINSASSVSSNFAFEK